MNHSIDLDALRALLMSQESMVQYYSGTKLKAAENAALVAANLKPRHSESDIRWDEEHKLKHQTWVAQLKTAIAFIEAER